MDNIVARLLAGESVDAIADEMAQTLNNAKAEADRIQEEERVRVQEQEAIKQEIVNGKRELIAAVLGSVADYLTFTQVDSDIAESLRTASDEELDKYAESIDQIVEFANGLKALEFAIPNVGDGFWFMKG